MLEVLKRDTIPVWAASLEMSARLTGLLITQYKSAIDTLYLSQQSVGEALDPTAQPPAQDVTSMNNFSSTDEVTFWPWRLEALVILQGVPIKMRHLFSFISPSVLMLQFYALYGQ